MKKIVLSLFIFILGLNTCFSQGNEDSNTTIIPVESSQESDAVNFYVIEQKPEFPGGEKAFYKYLAENIKYPEEAKKNKIEGTVWVEFIINKKGKIKNVKVIRSANPVLDKEAVRVIKSMPDWKPGKQHGKYVNVKFQAPISFKL